MIITLSSKKFIHYHLGASQSDYLSLMGNPYIFDRIIWNNCKDDRIFHLGGGRTNLIDDNLFKFKNKFSDTLSKYYVGGIIHNKTKFNKLIKIWENNGGMDNNIFLKYRFN